MSEHFGESRSIEGSVLRVDPIARELVLQSKSAVISVYAPPGCPIVLSDDSIRMRLIQPGDFVEIAVHRATFGWIAERISIERFTPAHIQVNG